ncbi:MAG: AAA family ATPase [Deltaproteobacteria bacterium]|nr:AAA family ATPase [Deltaproteobacteria bacterium]
MITGVSIKNFKVFKSLDVKGLSRVTLISGRNNCGKTSFLEAVFTLFDRNNIHNIPHLLNRRGVSQVVIRPEELWGPIFHNYQMNEDIEISLTRDGDKESVTYRYLDSYHRTIAAGSVGETGGVKLIQTGQSSTYMQALEMNYRLKDNVSFTSHCYIGPGGLELEAGSMDPQNYPYECIEAAYAAVPPDKLNSFTYIRLARKGEITIPHVFDYEMMQAALESDWEVR